MVLIDFFIFHFISLIRSHCAMEPLAYQMWSCGRVFRLLHRTSVHSRRGLSAFVEHVAASAATSPRPLKPTQLVSRLYQPSNLRDVGQDTRLQGEMTCKSQKLMLQAGLIYPSNPGCYYYLPATVRSMEKLARVAFVSANTPV